VVGGGFGGATCARYLRRYAPRSNVTLIEPSPRFVTCPSSNEVIGGLRDIGSITHSYTGLRRAGIELLSDWVDAIDPVRRSVHLHNSGEELTYDRLVLSPGITLRWNAIEGYDPAVAESIPHGWNAGEQTKLLRRQIEAMDDGGVVLISVPADPYRCPPGPYERASLIAGYLRRNKPRSKVVILDTKESFAQQSLFMDGWERLYPGMIDWVSGSDGGRVEALDAKSRTVRAGFGSPPHRGDVINIIPPQRAGDVATVAGLSDASGWCPVDPRTFESTLQANIHVIGDACAAGDLPKSAHAANSQAKVCATAIATALEGGTLPDPVFVNACYSLIAEDHGISTAGVYRVDRGEIRAVEGAGGASPGNATSSFRREEAGFARAWYRNIVADTFGV
jgi:sulfide dehydrogenase [flavocytochrome c] flavoprotein subunit